MQDESFINIITLHGDKEKIDRIYQNYFDNQDRDMEVQYPFDIIKATGEEHFEVGMSTIFAAATLYKDIELLDSKDYEDLSDADKATVIEYIHKTFDDIAQRLNKEGITKPFATRPIDGDYKKLYRQLMQFSPNITGYDIKPVLASKYYIDDLLKTETSVTESISFALLSDDELVHEDQTYSRYDNQTLIFALPTKYGPCIETVEALIEQYNIDAELLFGNGQCNGKAISRDGSLWLSDREVDYTTVFDRLNALGLYEWYCGKFGWKVEDKDNDELGEVIDESTVPALGVI